MKATHFGAGNIGRGFIGEILHQNGFSIDFVDINETIIDALKERNSYEIELAAAEKKHIKVEQVTGINNQKDPEDVIASVATSDIVTTAIGPNILPFIAELIAKGIQKRRLEGNDTPLDVIACENMIGGSQFLLNKVREFLNKEDLSYVDDFIGFPNAAVDRIVPMQQHDDPLFVSVEPFCEWLVDDTQSKAKQIRLDNVGYVSDLTPYIERKLFSVNTGHATTAYTGNYYGYTTIGKAIADDKVLNQLKAVLQETGNLLIAKWDFARSQHEQYIQKIIERFKNPYISDDVSRVARTPIRKLGYDERFIRPIREAKERGLAYQSLVNVVAMILQYDDPNDEESVRLQKMLKEKSVADVIYEVTGLSDASIVDEIVEKTGEN
ncbi:mannitol-1-phosphate 5-dehydrogenase [Tetragenococcus koreensis]|uniref:mannitol-1-phosphate 5-dehydrogenase n=1 Tax=Tetragenococcus koreensis TaxID=290335 RepID=UPI001F1FAA14|nr:mannitol-1-phosphate 5-dehydrogenase [Tetragenococcus koreensis]MCF1584807.1 mannitol-1-phosphate 5-dehydrogenase [Tetragenococcus koreensis]MCF1614568.1 mannitol-1-phosphate 5-dehydrogenase [Tetragenococcus koreensis]MCF1616713.1 mannitol-1-phosphate 5-dehydrogenase [Tetragenococcus koreensis]MCF1619954.1 mannitol-1-phosphate 5-dehydrogenase [Tetragenococcus koreensis]MCF1621595.1 mannitol-1-phosphate 5-dehydrogenase [Tetragenococcus koreensis]